MQEAHFQETDLARTWLGARTEQHRDSGLISYKGGTRDRAPSLVVARVYIHIALKCEGQGRLEAPRCPCVPGAGSR